MIDDGIVIKNRARLNQSVVFPWAKSERVEEFHDLKSNGETFARFHPTDQEDLRVTIPWKEEFTDCMPISVGYQRM